MIWLNHCDILAQVGWQHSVLRRTDAGLTLLRRQEIEALEQDIVITRARLEDLILRVLRYVVVKEGERDVSSSSAMVHSRPRVVLHI